MKKVLFLLHYPPPVHGAALVGEYIRKSKLINTSFDCKYVNLGTSVTIDEIDKISWKKWVRYMNIVWLAARLLFTFKPDLVYFTLSTSGVGFYKDAFLAIMIKMAGKKVVYHFHNQGIRLNQDKWWYHNVYKIAFKNAEVILLSKFLYKDIEKYVPEVRVRYCANGIPNIALRSLEQNNNKDDRVRILFLSNLLEAKGVYTLLEACKILKERKISFQCTYVGGEGDISKIKFLEKVRHLGLENEVHYAGKKFGSEKEEELYKAQIFTLPTYVECFPLVLLEAMQFALPVISTYVGGIPEMVVEGQSGFLIEPNDIRGLAVKLELLINNESLRQSMGVKGKKRYDTLYILNVFESRFIGILNQLC